MPWVWISLGSNLERETSLRAAVRLLRARYGPLVLSSVYESAAVGFEGAPFYNLVAGFEAREPVASLNAALRTIETACGRARGGEKFASRTLDLDLLTYGRLTGCLGDCTLPRDEILHHAFVLGPLAEVAGEESHPLQHRSYRELWSELAASAPPLRRVPFEFGPEPA